MECFLYTLLGTLGGSRSYAYALNNTGYVTGDADTRNNAAQHAFLYSGGAIIDLGTLGGSFSVGSAINASNQVAGSSFFDASGNYHAFLYSNGAMLDLGTLGGTNSYANGINASGQVTGESDTSTSGAHAFIYGAGTGLVDLNSLISANSEWTLTNATSISDNGYIVGYGVINGQSHAFLLSPAPEQSSVAALPIGVLGLGALALRARRRSAAGRFGII